MALYANGRKVCPTKYVGGSGEEIDVIPIGEAIGAQVGDKVLLNPTPARTNPVELEYTPVTNSDIQGFAQYQFCPMGFASTRYGILCNLCKSGNNPSITLEWDENQKRFIGKAGGVAVNEALFVWGTSKQLYAAYNLTASGFTGTTTTYGYFDSRDGTYVSKGTAGNGQSFQALRFFENHVLEPSRWLKITENGIVTVKSISTSSSAVRAFIPFNGEVCLYYKTTSSTALYPESTPNKSYSVTGLPFKGSEGNNGQIVALDEKGDFFIVGDYTTKPLVARFYRKTEASTDTSLVVEEVSELTELLPTPSSSANALISIQIDPMTKEKGFADIFIRYTAKQLYYLRWDGKTITNYGKVGGGLNEYYYSYNPYDRMLIVNKLITAEPANQPDYRIFSYTYDSEIPYTAYDLDTEEWSKETLTGFVTESATPDENGTPILKVSTSTGVK